MVQQNLAAVPITHTPIPWSALLIGIIIGMILMAYLGKRH